MRGVARRMARGVFEFHHCAVISGESQSEKGAQVGVLGVVALRGGGCERQRGCLFVDVQSDLVAKVH